MRKRTKALVGLAAAAVALGAGSAAFAAGGNPDPRSEQQAEAAYTDAHRSDAAVSQQDAEQRALAVHGDRIVESHLESEGDGLRWEVKPTDGTRVWEVQLDPASGAVVSDHVESEGA